MALDERQYAAVSRISRTDGRKLAAVVREAVERYCVEPAARRRRLEAIDALYGDGAGTRPGGSRAVGA